VVKNCRYTNYLLPATVSEWPVKLPVFDSYRESGACRSARGRKPISFTPSIAATS